MTKLLSLLLSVILAASLPGCSFLQTLTSSSTTPVGTTTVANAQNTVYTIKSGYGLALVAMTTYGSLPDCGKPASPPLCRSYTAMQSMEKARASTSAAITSAENEVNAVSPTQSVLSAAVSAAQAAWSSFQTIMANYNVVPAATATK